MRARHQTGPTRRSCSCSSAAVLKLFSNQGLFIRKKKVFPVPGGKTNFQTHEIPLESGTLTVPFHFPKETRIEITYWRKFAPILGNSKA
jgi:hypothetical protein